MSAYSYHVPFDLSCGLQSFLRRCLRPRGQLFDPSSTRESVGSDFRKMLPTCSRDEHILGALCIRRAIPSSIGITSERQQQQNRSGLWSCSGSAEFLHHKNQALVRNARKDIGGFRWRHFQSFFFDNLDEINGSAVVAPGRKLKSESVKKPKRRTIVTEAWEVVFDSSKN